MKVCDIVQKLNLIVFGGNEGINNPITGGYTSDLLSDVMGNVNENEVWITLQTHKNIMAIASLKEVAAIILVKGLAPSEAALEQSNEEGIPLLGTPLEAFEISGQLYDLIKKANE